MKSVKSLHNRSDDLVLCVPTRKGHHILYKGYTYIFKSRLQCGAEQWICSFRQKTGCISVINMQATGVEIVPEWLSTYYMKMIGKDEMKCNLCEIILQADDKSVKLLDHFKAKHIDVYTLHKDNPEANVGFRIEFIHLNVLKDDDGSKSQPIIIREMCTDDGEPLLKVPEPATDKDDEVNTQYVLINKKKKKKSETSDTRKRSWVWKYFDKLSNIIYRCNLCHVVLSIKGCNTNNMNRHVRTRHPQIFKKEIAKRELGETFDLNSEVDTPLAIKTEEIYASDRDLDEIMESPSQKLLRRSWIWSYFERVSSTQAQCKLCSRHITHGGNATGNMNRHLKMIHNKTGYQDDEKTDNDWVWKVFDADEDANTCKICQYRCIKYNEEERSMSHMLHHLKQEHGVVSGNQIITGAECDDSIQ